MYRLHDLARVVFRGVHQFCVRLRVWHLTGARSLEEETVLPGALPQMLRYGALQLRKSFQSIGFFAREGTLAVHLERPVSPREP